MATFLRRLVVENPANGRLRLFVVRGQRRYLELKRGILKLLAERFPSLKLHTVYADSPQIPPAEFQPPFRVRYTEKLGKQYEPTGAKDWWCPFCGTTRRFRKPNPLSLHLISEDCCVPFGETDLKHCPICQISERCPQVRDFNNLPPKVKPMRNRKRKRKDGETGLKPASEVARKAARAERRKRRKEAK